MKFGHPCCTYFKLPLLKISKEMKKKTDDKAGQETEDGA
jgi:hypothetical protein